MEVEMWHHLFVLWVFISTTFTVWRALVWIKDDMRVGKTKSIFDWRWGRRF
jgi:hypothetical protein